MSGQTPRTRDDAPGPSSDAPGDPHRAVHEELLRRQLAVHLPLPPATVLVVGAGRGAPCIDLARDGFEVVLVEDDPDRLATCRAALTAETPPVRSRFTVVEGRVGGLDTLAALGDRTFDAVLCHGLLPHLPDPQEPLRALGRRLAVDGIISITARNAGALAWRHAQGGDLDAATAALEETERARWDRRDPRCLDEHGVECRADSLERLGAYLGGIRCALELWYGVGTVTDGWAPDDPRWPRLGTQGVVDLEERLGRTEPYRRAGTLLHLVGRRGEGRGPVL